MTHMSPENATFYGLNNLANNKSKPVAFRDSIYRFFSLFTKILKFEYLVYVFE